jgi:hypothetical protein
LKAFACGSRSRSRSRILIEFIKILELQKSPALPPRYLDSYVDLFGLPCMKCLVSSTKSAADQRTFVAVRAFNMRELLPVTCNTNAVAVTRSTDSRTFVAFSTTNLRNTDAVAVTRSIDPRTFVVALHLGYHESSCK